MSNSVEHRLFCISIRYRLALRISTFECPLAVLYQYPVLLRAADVTKMGYADVPSMSSERLRDEVFTREDAVFRASETDGTSGWKGA